MFHRHTSLRTDKIEGNNLSIIGSSDDAVDVGGWREVLKHGPDQIDMDGARALLINHNPNQIAGPLRSLSTNGKQTEATAEILPEARMESGITVKDGVESGALRGISIGYTYDRSDAVWDSETRTLTVNRWRLLEVSLTPIPADQRASVRSIPFDLDKQPKEPTVADPVITDQAAEVRAANARAEKAERTLKLRTTADQHGVDVTGLDLGSFATVEEGLSALLERKATAQRATVAGPVVKVTADAGDKLLAEVAGTLHRSANVKPDGADLELITKHKPGNASLRMLISKIAESDGVRSNSELDLAAWASGAIDLRTFGRRDAPNKITAGFSQILANVAHKAVLAGLNGYNAATWAMWCTQRNVPNFLSVTNAGLASGRLTKTPEGEAFPELNQKDGGYSTQLGLYGATVSLSFQALVNDQLGFFMGELRRAGAIAAQTIDRRCYQVLLNATWTNDTSAASGLATPANLDKPRAALKNKRSPAGEKMGIVARYLLHDTANAVPAQVATGAIYGPGQTTAPSQGSRSIIPIESHWIGDTALLGGALTTDYYLTGSPDVVDTVLVNFLDGLGMAPMIAPFDAGATASEKWKIMVPFEATVATHTDGPTTPVARVSGMQKATVA